ncbi:MAG: hypothetical protein WDN48_11670 [Pseudolabrys sp.]
MRSTIIRISLAAATLLATLVGGLRRRPRLALQGADVQRAGLRELERLLRRLERRLRLRQVERHQRCRLDRRLQRQGCASLAARSAYNFQTGTWVWASKAMSITAA